MKKQKVMSIVYFTSQIKLKKKQESFGESIFEDFVYFSHAHFESGAEFSAVVFEKFADFSDVTFKGKTQFDHSRFKGGVKFRRAKFLTFYISFWRVKFFGEVDFIETLFGGIVHFIDACFFVSGEISFKKAVFKGKAEFINSIFRDFADFRGKPKGEEYKFYDELSFELAEFSKGLNIGIPSEWFKLPQAEAEACRIQRLHYERDGRKDDADRMFVRERRAIRRAVVKRAKEELKHSKNTKSKSRAIFGLIKAWISSATEWFLADLTCEYGTNWKRPVFLWVGTVIFLFPILYLVTNGIKGGLGWTLDLVAKMSLSTFISKLLECIYLSISVTTPMGHEGLSPVGLGKVLASIETIFVSFMWAVFLVVFARKYMR